MVNLVIQRLRIGAESRPMFDRRSRAVYVLLAFAIAAGATLFRLMKFSIDPSVGLGPPAWALLALGAAFLARRVGHERIGTALETTALVYAQGIVFLFVIYPLMSLHIPLADSDLAAADSFLGFDWPTYALLFTRNELLAQAASSIYRSFQWQPALVCVALASTGRLGRAWQFVTAATVALCLTALIGPLFPAAMPAAHFGIAPRELPFLIPFHPWRFEQVLHALKDDGVRVLAPWMLVGIVSLPSYHMAAGVMFAWATWPTILRWPMIVLNTALAAATIVIGPHYLVDVIAGGAVAIASIYVARLWVKDEKCNE
ncbi:MAG: phosphatase PAP2 family protein [Rhodospirillales bacterium]